MSSAENKTEETFNLEQEIASIPDQMAFKIGDVADILKIKSYVLRYWEQEFKALSPKKAVNNQRIYSRRDIETALLIKKFLYIDQFSIPGARKALKEYRENQNKENQEKKLNQSTARGHSSSSNRTVKLNDSEIQIEGASATERYNSPAIALPDSYIKIEASIAELISKIKSIKGKIEHKFHQIGL